jgi:hypothetical protein
MYLKDIGRPGCFLRVCLGLENLITKNFHKAKKLQAKPVEPMGRGVTKSIQNRKDV